MVEVDKWVEVRKIATEGCKHFEGCHLTSYIFPGETWATLGWGEAISLSQHPKTITQAEADLRFVQTLKRKELALRREIPAKVLDQLSVEQLAGLLMFRYNLKDPAWLDPKCNTRRFLAAGNFKKFVEWHGKWVNGQAGTPLGGLKRRRHVERDLMTGKTLADVKKVKWYQGLY